MSHLKIIIAYFTFKKILIDVFNLFLDPNHKYICVYMYVQMYANLQSISVALEYIKKIFFGQIMWLSGSRISNQIEPGQL